MLKREIIYHFQRRTLACDGKCEKAWGVNNRPRIQLDAEDPDDFAWKADGELGTAPADPGTYEGGHGKPDADHKLESKWCARECERSDMVEAGQLVTLRDFSRRFYNCAPHTRDEDLVRVVTKSQNLELIQNGLSMIQGVRNVSVGEDPDVFIVCVDRFGLKMAQAMIVIEGIVEVLLLQRNSLDEIFEALARKDIETICNAPIGYLEKAIHLLPFRKLCSLCETWGIAPDSTVSRGRPDTPLHQAQASLFRAIKLACQEQLD